MPGVLENHEVPRIIETGTRTLDTSPENTDLLDTNMKGGSRNRYPNGYNSDQMSDAPDDGPRYMLEHLATFSVGSQFGLVSPKDGLRRLLQMEKSNGIWTQKMQMKLNKNWVFILDYEDGDVVEKFPMNLISDPTAYTSDDPRELYNNILIFIVREDSKNKNPNQSEMHIFQCARVYAQDVVDEIKMFMSGKIKARSDNVRHLPPPPHNPPPEPPINGNSSKVREHVAMFSAPAPMSSPTHPSPPRGPLMLPQRIERSSYARESNDETSSTTSDKYEREVTILNHCFDDIERFVVRLQHAAAAFKELERRQKSRKHKKKDMGDGMLSIRAKPPPEREFVDVLQKFKLSFNLLAKLKSHIHDPNAPELVHFLFTPLALIIDAARDSNHSANLAANVVSPLLTRDAIELLANCCTSKETDLWHSLGDSWIIPRDQWKGYESNYRPVFSNGWAPEREDGNLMAHRRPDADLREQDYQRVLERDSRYGSEYFGSERDEEPLVVAEPHMRPPYDHMPPESRREIIERAHGMESEFPDVRSEFSSDSIEHSEPQRQFDRHQMQWLEELKSHRSKVVQVVYPRTANNEKELTVVRGEILEVLDDSRKWWKARNMRGQVAHVPHTIITPYPSDDRYYATDGSPMKEQYMEDDVMRSQEPPSGVDNTSPPVRPKVQCDTEFPSPPLPYLSTFTPPIKENASPPNWLPQPPQDSNKSAEILSNQVASASDPKSSIDGPGTKAICSTSNKQSSILKENIPQNTSSIKKGSSKIKNPSSPDVTGSDGVHQDLQEELKASIAQKKGSRVWKKITCPEHNTTECYYIHSESSGTDVAHWLKLKGFSERALQVVSPMSAEELFRTSKTQLETHLDEEGAKLHSHLLIQKNMSGYKTCTSEELKVILAQRKQKTEL